MLIAARMFSEGNGNVFTIGVNATLEVDCSYRRQCGKEVTIQKGTAIYVDEDKGIGYFDGDHFELDIGEYSISFQN
jgi:hypothetical protein